MNTKTFSQNLFGLLVFCLLAAFSLFALTGANVTKARPNGYEFSTVVQDESEADSLIISQDIKNQTAFFWQFNVTQDSFATDATIILYESAWDTEDYWYPRDTLTIAAAGAYRFTGVTDARRLMSVITTDTTNQQITTRSAANLTENF
jgi:hypothetical protein